MTEHILTLTCVDEPGTVHAVNAGLLDVSGNIIDNAQFTEPDTNTFRMRTSVSAPGVDSDDIRAAASARLGERPIQLKVRPADRRTQVLIMVSKLDHCLVDLRTAGGTGCCPSTCASSSPTTPTASRWPGATTSRSSTCR